MIWEPMLRLVLKHFGGISVNDWRRALDIITRIDEAAAHRSGPVRDQLASREIEQRMPHLALFAQRLLLGLAVAWLAREGVIHVKPSRQAGLVLPDGETYDDNGSEA